MYVMNLAEGDKHLGTRHTHTRTGSEGPIRAPFPNRAVIIARTVRLSLVTGDAIQRPWPSSSDRSVPASHTWGTDLGTYLGRCMITCGTYPTSAVFGSWQGLVNTYSTVRDASQSETHRTGLLRPRRCCPIPVADRPATMDAHLVVPGQPGLGRSSPMPSYHDDHRTTKPARGALIRLICACGGSIVHYLHTALSLLTIYVHTPTALARRETGRGDPPTHLSQPQMKATSAFALSSCQTGIFGLGNSKWPRLRPGTTTLGGGR